MPDAWSLKAFVSAECHCFCNLQSVVLQLTIILSRLVPGMRIAEQEQHIIELPLVHCYKADGMCRHAGFSNMILSLSNATHPKSQLCCFQGLVTLKSQLKGSSQQTQR